jgi:hypothetical protein
MNGYATSNPDRGYDYQWSGAKPEFIANDFRIVDVWYDTDPDPRPEWTLYPFTPLPVEQVIDILNQKINNLYKDRSRYTPGCAEWTAFGYRVSNTLRLLEKARQRARWFYHIRDHK